jgi:hypothetical protein
MMISKVLGPVKVNGMVNTEKSYYMVLKLRGSKKFWIWIKKYVNGMVNTEESYYIKYINELSKLNYNKYIN